MGKDLYRSRIEKPMDKEVLRFLSSMNDDIWIAYEDIIGTIAHNIMLYEQHILNKGEIKLILQSLMKIREKFLNNELEFDPNFEDIHPFIENCVIEDIGMDVGGKIHTGRSRNDQVSVDMRLKMKSEFNELTKELFKLINSIVDLASKNGDVPMPLYTHLQKGQLGLFSHYCINYSEQILRSVVRIEEVYVRLNKNPLGACAIGGTSIDINRIRTSELLGFDGLVENSVDAISSRDYIIESLMVLSIISLQSSRIAEDLLLWSSKEFDFVELDEQFCSVSSVMPQKKNPDTLELIRAKSSTVISNVTKASLIVKAVPTGYYRDFQELKPILKESFMITTQIIKILRGIFSTLEINKERLLETLRNSYILALDLAEILVQEYSIPFRQSHKIVAELIRESHGPGDLFQVDLIKKITKKITKQDVEINPEIIERISDPIVCLESRKSQGSPSLELNNQTLSKLKNELSEEEDKFKKRLQKQEDSKENLEKIIKDLVK